MTREEQIKNLKELKEYEIIEVKSIPDLDSDGVTLRHVKTGAKVALLINDDNNKVFYIGFRTPPKDSTGVAHIIEHTVLCGSDKYPVKDPFIELAKGSLNTFLNAMTFPDKTIYPVASLNSKDFDNLCDVYLDAVFHPNIYKEPKIFMQEGWHYELEDPDDDLKINGVVYNEMRGAFSSPDDVVEREIMNSLYPHTSYGVESGGDPDNIPDLTYDEFIDFHSRYYHPSNCYIYLYGDCDMARKLKEIDEEYLSKYDALDIDSSVGFEEKFDKPVYVRKEYPVAENSSGNEQTYLTYNVSVSDNNLDADEYIAFDVLEYALASTPGAPIKKALIDAGIGKDVFSENSNGISQPCFSIIAKETDIDRQDEFVSIIEENLARLAGGELNKDTLRAAINLFEFKYREADYGTYPKGLMIGIKVLDSWLYDDKQPFVHVICNDTYGRLKSYVDTDYFERLIQDKLLNNTHKVILAVTPHPGLTGIKDKALADRLKEYKDSLSENEIKDIVSQTKELAEYQESEDSPEALATIPMLKREDLTREADPFVYERKDIGSTEGVIHDVFTNGIGYLRFIFRCGDIPADMWPYVGLLKTVMGLMDTSDYGYFDLYNTISLNTGGIYPVVEGYTDANDNTKYTITYDIEAKALYEKLDCAIDLMTQMILTTKYNDKTRLKEIMDEAVSNIKASMTGAGHSLAASEAAAEFQAADATMNSINGVPFLRMLEDMVSSYDEKFEEIVDRLNEVSAILFTRDNFMVDYTGSKDSYESISDAVRAFADKLYEKKPGVSGSMVSPSRRSIAYTTAAQVQYVARCGSFTDAGFDYTGALKVLKVIMGYDYLWTQVRVLGGAYGCMSMFTRAGKGVFVSYRDPNLERTVEVYENAPGYIREFDADERTMTQYIIGAVADVDIPKPPRAKGSYGRVAYMTGLTMDIIQKDRDELLGATAQTIRDLAPLIEAVMDTKAYCVVGCEEKIRAAADGFDRIEALFSEA